MLARRGLVKIGWDWWQAQGNRTSRERHGGGGGAWGGPPAGGPRRQVGFPRLRRQSYDYFRKSRFLSKLRFFSFPTVHNYDRCHVSILLLVHVHVTIKIELPDIVRRSAKTGPRPLDGRSKQDVSRREAPTRNYTESHGG